MKHAVCRLAALCLLPLLLFSFSGCAGRDALAYQEKAAAFTGTFTFGDVRFHGTLTQTPKTDSSPRTLCFTADAPEVFSGLSVRYDGTECLFSYGGISRALPAPPPSFLPLFALFSVPRDATVSRMRNAFCASSSGTVWNVTLQNGFPSALHAGDAHFEVESVTLP